MNEVILNLLEKKRSVFARLSLEAEDARDSVRRAENKLVKKKAAVARRRQEVIALEELLDAVEREEISEEQAEARARKVYYNR